MSYITRTLEFFEGELVTPDAVGWRNWRVVAVLNSHLPTDDEDHYLLLCLIEDSTV